MIIYRTHSMLGLFNQELIENHRPFRPDPSFIKKNLILTELKEIYIFRNLILSKKHI